MGIKSNDRINASDIDNSTSAVDSLKEKILKLYKNRTLTVSNRTLYDKDTKKYYNDIDSVSNIETGKKIYQSNLGKLIDACLIINDIPNLRTTAQDTIIFRDGSNTNLLTWLDNNIINATGTSTDHGCRGACVGICTAGCYGEGRGVTGTNDGSSSTGPGSCSDCDSSCQGSCNGGCNTGCTDNCEGCQKNCEQGCGSGCNGGCCSECTQGCLGDDTAYGVSCGNGCSFTCYGTGVMNSGTLTITCNTCWNGCVACKGSCGSGNCKGSCAGCSGCTGCSTGCKDSCGTLCYNGCKNGCQKNCKDECATGCTNGCYGSAKNNTYT